MNVKERFSCMNDEEINVPLKFYHVLVYFGLYAGALLNAVVGLRYISGRIYESTYTTAADIYEMFPGLQFVNICYGIVCFAMALFAVYVRDELKNFKKGAPQKYYILLLSMIFTPLIYLGVYLVFFANQTSGIAMSTWIEYAGEFITQILVLYFTRVYFKKREFLFVNES